MSGTTGTSSIDGPDYEIVELSGSGHRLWYVSLLLERAIEQGLSFRLTVSPQAFSSPGWAEFVAPLLRARSFEVNVSSKSRGEIVTLATAQDVRLVIPDGDRWIGALLAQRVRGQALAANLLIMRPFPESAFRSRVKQRGKRALWSIADRVHPRLSIYRLVAVPRGACEVPDPVVLHTPPVLRDEWIRSHALDPSMKWLVVLGELSPRKHLPEIVEAFASQQLRSSSWGVAAVGTMQPDLEVTLTRRASTSPARIAIRNGFVSAEDFDSWIAHADAVAVLHRNEGSSGVLLKCWAAGTAVLAGGARSVISAAEDLELPGKTISLVTPNSIADAVVRLEAGPAVPRTGPSNDSLTRRNRRFVDSLLSLQPRLPTLD